VGVVSDGDGVLGIGGRGGLVVDVVTGSPVVSVVGGAAVGGGAVGAGTGGAGVGWGAGGAVPRLDEGRAVVGGVGGVGGGPVRGSCDPSGSDALVVVVPGTLRIVMDDTVVEVTAA
jgi:hypothetical protein